MALRITNKERQLIRQLNAKAQRKSNRLFKTYGKKYMTFKTTKVKDFKTRQELNKYKQDINWYLRPATHRYVKGGLVTATGNKYFYPIPREEAWKIRRELRKRNQAVAKFIDTYGSVTLDVMGRKQDATLNYILRQRASKRSGGLNTRGSAYRPLKFDPKQISSKKTLDRFKYAVKKQSRKGLLKKQRQAKFNYTDALFNTFGALANPLIQAIDKLTTQEFVAFYESDMFSDFSYIYDITHANTILQAITTHFLNFLDQRNIGIDDQLKEILEESVHITSSKILSYYGKGAYGGERVIIPTPTLKTTYYIDLHPDEAEMYRQAGQDINALIHKIIGEEEYKKRLKVLSEKRYIRRNNVKSE